MKEFILFTIMLGIGVSSEVLDDTNNSETEAEVSFIRSLFPIFEPVDIENEENNFKDDIDPRESVNVTVSQKSTEPFIVIVRKIIIEDDEIEDQNDLKFPGFEHFFEKYRLMDEEIGFMDLSWKNITGDELALALRSRLLRGEPVTELVLSNSRISGLTAASFLPAETTLQKLIMDNCSVSLEALTRLNNLRVLNLSNTGLTTFEWYPKLQNTLEVLDLSHNQLEEVRPELSVLTSLLQLYLSYNKINSVKEYPLVMLPNLEVISLTMNSLDDATFTSLHNLQRVDLDWNFLRLCGEDLKLPSHVVSVKMSSNPWRCDCGLLQARESHNILDIDILRCANSVSYALCDDCKRYFLPFENYNLVWNLTKDSIHHLGCTGLVDQYYLLRDALVEMREKEPDKLIQLAVMIVICIAFTIVAIMLCRNSFSRKKSNRKTWLSIHQIPYLKIAKPEKIQEIPYIKIDEPHVKA